LEEWKDAVVGWLSHLRSKLKEQAGLPTVAPRDLAVQKLQQSMALDHSKRSSVITVAATADSAARARDILQEMINAFLKRHLQINRTAGSYSFFVEQSQLLEQKMKDAAEQLRNAKNESGIVSIEGERSILQEQINGTEKALRDAETGFAATAAKIAAMHDALAELPERVITQDVSGNPNVGADYMRDELYKLQIREQELLSKFTTEHPLVQAVHRQVEDAVKIMEGQPLERTQTTLALNPAWQQLDLELLREEPRGKSLSSEVAELKQQRGRLQVRLRDLNDHEVGISELERRVSTLEQSTRAYAANLEQARIDQALAEDRITNVNVAQSPTFVSKPSSPRTTLILAAGFAAAFVGAIGLAMVVELTSQTFATPGDVEESLGLPVLISVPRMSRRNLRLPRLPQLSRTTAVAPSTGGLSREGRMGHRA
jgi:uncharacterized protein involved in exopolysaccharide biosynthesis